MLCRVWVFFWGGRGIRGTVALPVLKQGEVLGGGGGCTAVLCVLKS